jgi:hypothetical protein
MPGVWGGGSGQGPAPDMGGGSADRGAGRVVICCWNKRVWGCVHAAWPMRTWTEVHTAMASRVCLTERAWDWALSKSGGARRGAAVARI